MDSKHEVLWQTWIVLEERLGDVLRANELRSYSMEQRRQIALPKDFDMLKEDTNLLEDFFTKVNTVFDELSQLRFSFRIGLVVEGRRQKSEHLCNCFLYGIRHSFETQISCFSRVIPH